MSNMDPLDEIPSEKIEALRAALAALVREGVALSVRRLRERAGAKMQHAQLVLAAYRAGRFPLELPPPALAAPPASPPAAAPAAPPPPAAGQDGAPEVPLDQLVAGVDSHEKHVAACQRITRELAGGRLDPKRAKALLEALREMRQGIKGAALEGVEEIEELLPCTREGGELVGVFEAIENDARRERVLALARAELAADELERPAALGRTTESEGVQ